jgi:hypothetical protein
MVSGIVSPKDHAELKALAEERGRPLKTLCALDAKNDPYMVGQPWRSDRAHWFVGLYNRLRLKLGIHVRHIFYKLVSQREPVFRLNGKPFENTVECFTDLSDACRDARYIDLIPAEAIIDRRNPPPIINDRYYAAPAQIQIIDGGIVSHAFGREYLAPSLTLPEMVLISEPHIGQRYHLEIWIEKSTANEVLLPLGVQYGINIATFVGEVSATSCKNLVDRAIAAGRPVRIFHITDFDPGGRSMPVAAAAKIDFYARKSGVDLDIQLEHVALTAEQCIYYELPKTPIKESELRFKDQFGEGGTELDALEATHPGALRQILVEHIERYYDHDLNESVSEAVGRFRTEIERATSEVRGLYADEFAALEERRSAINLAFEQVRNAARETYEAAVEPTRRAYYAAQAQAMVVFNEALEQSRDEIMEMQQDLIAEAEPLIAEMAEDLAQFAPDPELFDWPEPAEAEEGEDDPLYDSTRTYVEQVDRFREYQGKDADVRLARDRLVTKTCFAADCGKIFETAQRKQKFCSASCATRHSHRLRYAQLRQTAEGKKEVQK